jgi:hypothetical protein
MCVQKLFAPQHVTAGVVVRIFVASKRVFAEVSRGEGGEPVGTYALPGDASAIDNERGALAAISLKEADSQVRLEIMPRPDRPSAQFPVHTRESVREWVRLCTKQTNILLCGSSASVPVRRTHSARHPVR